MAKNQVYKPGYQLSVVVTDPTTPNSGDPVRCGSLTGVALTKKGEGGNLATETTVDFGPGAWDIPVKGEAGAISVWDALYYDDAISAVNNDATNGYFFGFAMETVGNGETATINVLHVPSPGAGTLADGVITAGKLANNALSADATGRAKMQAGFFGAGVAASIAHFATAFWTNAIVAKFADGLFAADAASRAKFVDGIWTEAKLAAASLTGLVAAVVADANVIGGLLVIHRIDVADASGDTDVVLTHKTRIIDAWGLNTGIAANATLDTWQVKNGANAISDAVQKTATVNAVRRIATIDPARAEIAAGGTLRITAAKNTNAAATIYVLGIRVA
jgi:predicted RecA/RadA family phage recombinase